MRGNTELKEVFRSAALTAGGPTRFNTQFPLGEGWVKMILRFDVTVVIGTGAGVVSQAILKYIRSITFRTDKGDYPINNAPLRMLYWLAAIKKGNLPRADSVAAGSATYTAIIPIWFADPLAVKPEDTIFNSGRYSTVELLINAGTVSDLYSAPGTATATAVVSCYIDRQRGPVPKEIAPAFTVEYGVRGPIDPSANAYIDLERAQNLAYKKLLVWTGVANIVSGQPFSGDGTDTVLSDLTVEHDGGRPFETTPWVTLQYQNKDDYMLEAAMAGLSVQDFSKDGSMQSALYSGDKARLREMWTYSAGTAQLTVGYEALRPLVP